MAATAASAAAAAGAERGGPASIVTITLRAEDAERQPFTLPTEPGNNVEVDFPWPLEDWAGRGFTPDSERYAGDFVIEATRGAGRLFVTPVAEDAHRVLHVVLAQPGGGTRSLPLEFIPAPPSLAWRKVVFTSGQPASPGTAPVTLSERLPQSRLREPGPSSEIGLIRTLRLMLNTTAEGARTIAAANPRLSLAVLSAPPRSFGDFTVTCRFALRDSTTGALGLCPSVANQTARRLLFDPMSWVLRAGQRVYPIRTVDFPSELEPGATAAAFLVLASGADGGDTRLLAENEFEPSVLLRGSANPRPVKRLSLQGFDPR